MPNPFSKLVRKGPKKGDESGKAFAVGSSMSDNVTNTSHIRTSRTTHRSSRRGVSIRRRISKAPNQAVPLTSGDIEEEDDEASWEILGPVSPPGLSSKPAEPTLRTQDLDHESRKEMLAVGITAITLCQGVSELILPKYVGNAIQKVADLLWALKKMIENKESWMSLISILEEHQKVFNEQLARMEKEDLVPDPESPLLAPVKVYSIALEELTAGVLARSGLVLENAPTDSSWARIKTFCSRFKTASSEDDIQEYAKQLTRAMEQFKLSLAIFTSFTVNEIQIGAMDISSRLQATNEKLADISEKLDRLSEPMDKVGSRNIMPFGGQHNSCLEGTRVEVLREINEWAFSSAQVPSIYCLMDAAGTGKSTIAKTLANQWYKEQHLAAMFFFSQEDSLVRTASDFCHSVADQIDESCSNPRLTEHWGNIARSRKNLPSREIEEQWLKLVHQPLTVLGRGDPSLIVIDALDECTMATRDPLLRCLISSVSSGELPNIRILLTTRNETDIRHLLRLDVHKTLILRKSPLSHAGSADITFYIDHRLKLMEGVELSAGELALLVSRSGGLFIFAFLACEILQESHTKNQPLRAILDDFTSLDALYHRVLARADRSPDHTRDSLRKMLGIIVVAKVPLSIRSISTLLPESSDPRHLGEIISNLASIIGSGGLDDPVYIIHSTFTEFLLRQHWVTTRGWKAKNEYAISRSHSNRLAVRGCLLILLDQRNNGIASSGARDSHHDGAIPVGRVTPALQYAASAWILHMIPELPIKETRKFMANFFQEALLHWIEVGGIRKDLKNYMLRVGNLLSAMKNLRRRSVDIIDEVEIQWCIDTMELLHTNWTTLEHSPQHIYSSALVFAPRNSLVSQHYNLHCSQLLPKVPIGYQKTSNSVLLMGHTKRIECVAYSSDGELVVSAAYEGKIIVWEVRSGYRLRAFQLEGRPRKCLGIQLLPGNGTIVSVWDDHRLHRLSCDGTSPPPPGTLNVQGWLASVAWAPDLKTFVCGTHEGYIYRFSLETGMRIGRPVVASGGIIVTGLSFSPDGSLLATISAGGSIQFWGVTALQLTPQKAGWQTGTPPHLRKLRFSVVNSPLARIKLDLMRVYTITGEAACLEKNHGRSIVRLPKKYEFAAQKSDAGYMYFWRSRGFPWECQSLVYQGSSNRPTMISIETGHTDKVTCLALCPNGEFFVTGSLDTTLRIHDMSKPALQGAKRPHRSQVHSLGFTLDGKRLASADLDGRLCVWDIKGGSLIIQSVATGIKLPVFAFTSDGQAIACAEKADAITIWDIEPWIIIAKKLRMGSGSVWAMSFSPDNSRLAITTSIGTLSPGCIVIMEISSDHQIGDPLTLVSLGSIPHSEIRKLAYHPSGDHICCGKKAWSIATKPYKPVANGEIGTILDDTFPAFINIKFDRDASRGPLISIGKWAHSLYTPADFKANVHTIQDGLIALGAADGRVMVLNFTHIFNSKEITALNRIYNIRQETVARTPSQIHENLSTYTQTPEPLPPLPDVSDSDSDISSWSMKTDKAYITTWRGIYPRPGYRV